MSEYDDRQPRKAEPSPGQVQDPLKKLQDEEMHEMWRGLKDRIRRFFVREEKGDHRRPRH